MLLLAVLFIGIPFIEVSLLIKLGTVIGFWPTLFTQIVTGFVGASLARWQGLKVWFGIQMDLAQGQMPAESIIDGLLILVAGLVMLTPGLLTDAVGFLFLIPWTRKWIRHRLQQKFLKMSQNRQSQIIYLVK